VSCYRRERTQSWCATDLGFESVHPTITGGIFEPGFPDYFQQMLASYFAERAGRLNGRFGCATIDEALLSHRLFSAALASADSGQVMPIP